MGETYNAVGDLELQVRPLTQRTGWTTTLGALLGALLPPLLEALQAWDAPAWLRPWVPVVTAVLGFLLALVKDGNSVPARAVYDAPAPVVPVRVLPDGTRVELER